MVISKRSRRWVRIIVAVVFSLLFSWFILLPGNFSKIGGESTDLLRLGTSCDKYGQLWDLIFVTDTIIYVFPK